jgi:hypothetical protein
MPRHIPEPPPVQNRTLPLNMSGLKTAVESTIGATEAIVYLGSLALVTLIEVRRPMAEPKSHNGNFDLLARLFETRLPEYVQFIMISTASTTYSPTCNCNSYENKLDQ